MIGDFVILVMTHFISDFFLQPFSWATGKTESFRYLLFHSIQYSLPFLLIFYFLGISLFWFFWIFITHLIFDNKIILDWFDSFFYDSKSPFWTTVVRDQILHILVLMAVVW